MTDKTLKPCGSARGSRNMKLNWENVYAEWAEFIFFCKYKTSQQYLLVTVTNIIINNNNETLFLISVNVTYNM